MLKKQYYEKTSKRQHYKKDWKPLDVWLAEKRAEEAAKKARHKQDTERAEKTQSLMEFKERAEDFCETRFRHEDGTDFIQLGLGDDPFEAWTYIPGCGSRCQQW